MKRPTRIAVLVTPALALIGVALWANWSNTASSSAAQELAGPPETRQVAEAPSPEAPEPTEPSPPPPSEEPVDPLHCGPVRPDQHRGMSFAHSWRGGGYGSASSGQEMAAMADVGVDWISLIPFGYMPSVSATEVGFRPDGNRGETDASLRGTTAQARALGISVLMKPHLWLHTDGWRGEITFATEAEWDAWFESYTRFILHYAELSEELEIEMLAVGVELRSTTASHPEHWRRLIERVRVVYSGEIVYAANWDEVANVPFWDAVDYIGVQMFAPLASSANAPRGELIAAAEQHLEHYGAIAKRFDRQLILTEVGFRSVDDTAVSPWVWPRRGDEPATREGEQAQVDAYCAIIETFGRSVHVAGMYWWKWYTSGNRQDGPRGFSPRDKPAESVLRYAFASES